MQRVWNLMFTFIGHIHFVILTHCHHNNIYNNIDNNNNNSFCYIYTKKDLFLLPTPTEKVSYATVLYPNLQAIYTIQKVTLSNKFFQLEEGLWRSFPPLMLVILGSPCLPFLLIHTHHKYKIKSWTDPTSSFP